MLMGYAARRSVKVVMVLRGQNRCRAENRHLLARRHHFERAAQGDFGFAEAHVAADQAIHRLVVFQIALHVVDGAQLVGRLAVGERLLHLHLPVGIGAERGPLRGLTGRVEPDQFARHFARLIAHLLGGALPLVAADLVDLRAARPPRR